MVPAEAERRREFLDNLLKVLGPRSSEEDSTGGTFAVCKSIKHSPEGFILKSFHVGGAGEFQLPLAAKDIPQLRAVCQQATFGDELVIPRRMRRQSTTVNQHCWQVEASKLSFPGTPTFLTDVIQGITQQAVCALGFDERRVKVEAQLQKLLLYETGGQYTFHRDTQKVRGIVGTLILQLPTEEGFTGGSLVLRQHKSQSQCDKKVFDCHLLGDVGFCYIVFVRDCLHELTKINTGTRLCLAFNLVRSDVSLDRVSREFIRDKVQEVQGALQPWLEEATRRRSCIFGAKLAIPLQHKYSRDNLCFAWLMGDDKILAEVLQNCRDNNNEEWLDLHLCLVTKTIIGDVTGDYSPRRTASPSMVDNHYGSIEFKNWIGPHDTSPSTVCKGLSIHLEKEVVTGEGTGPFASKPDNTEYWENSIDSFDRERPTHSLALTYHASLLVVWPKLLSFAVACEVNFSRALPNGQRNGKRQRIDEEPGSGSV